MKNIFYYEQESDVYAIISRSTYSEVTVINTQPHEKIVFEIRDQVRCVGRASRISTALNILLVSPFLIICFKKISLSPF